MRRRLIVAIALIILLISHFLLFAMGTAVMERDVISQCKDKGWYYNVGTNNYFDCSNIQVINI